MINGPLRVAAYTAPWHAAPRTAGLAALVAHHTGARFEAAERNLTRELAEFSYEDSAVMDALVTADLTTGPADQLLEVQDRLDEILRRYPLTTYVHRAVLKARPSLEAHALRTIARFEQGDAGVV
ncbi:hypothetical protein Cs7R123_32310 [Catellatospora sp. TT07R-123]|uniref:hypothetical protein n=1 Tax=Catellatospora sp. TT07R-123 TaxID=2733863 RepID=UPI001B16AE48|nr:hypothetical protein [Catellatospora sp. TT07R-123]GHJ45889.1 hypothetical protein Cs7R123_32310 [Catellatospora sp. TT07R-123]